MHDWEWESFGNYVNREGANITEAGPLYGPIHHFKITRNKDLHLFLETSAAQNARSDYQEHPEGTVRINTDKITITSAGGMKIIAEGIQPQETKRTFHENPLLGKMEQLSSLSSLEASLSDDLPSYVIEWLANVGGEYLWPCLSDDLAEIKKTRKLCHQENAAIIMTGTNKAESHHRNCVKICVDKYEVYLCTTRLEGNENIEGSGFILYVGNPSLEIRRKIRDCLSYATGRYLVCLGHSCFSSKWSLLSFKAISAYSLGGDAFKLPTIMPTPLGKQYKWEIDQDFLTRMICSLYKNYDAIRFNSLSWGYWHAVCATPHIAPVHYGAIIEALQQNYLKLIEESFATSIVGKEIWQPLQAAFLSNIEALKIGKADKKILKNKIRNVNSQPHSVKTEKIFERLHLKLSEKEKAAWKRRNVAGHGGATNENEQIDLIKDIKLLNIRFNRLLLSITNASDFYYDYFSIGCPIRNLGEEIPANTLDI